MCAKQTRNAAKAHEPRVVPAPVRAGRNAHLYLWLSGLAFGGLALAGGFALARWADRNSTEPDTTAVSVSTSAPSESRVPSVVVTDNLPAGIVRADFDLLAGFPFQAPGLRADKNPAPVVEEANRQIPDEVRALDGKRVRVRGFLLSSDFSNGLSREFLILRSHMLCCFGMQPAGNEWVVVKVPPPGVAIQQDVPMDVIGTLHVGAVAPDGFFSRIYTLDGESVRPAPAEPYNPLFTLPSKNQKP